MIMMTHDQCHHWTSSSLHHLFPHFLSLILAASSPSSVNEELNFGGDNLWCKRELNWAWYWTWNEELKLIFQNHDFSFRVDWNQLPGAILVYTNLVVKVRSDKGLYHCIYCIVVYICVYVKKSHSIPNNLILSIFWHMLVLGN